MTGRESSHNTAGRQIPDERALDMAAVAAARVIERIAFVRCDGPESTIHGGRRNDVALVEALGRFEATRQPLEDFLADRIAAFPHERLRDIEGMLSTIRDEHGGLPVVLKILQDAGVSTVEELAGKRHAWFVIYQRCEGILHPGEPSDAMSHATDAAALAPAAAPDAG